MRLWYMVKQKANLKRSAFKFQCPRRDLNPHRRCGRQDFKSCVSTNFTTRASGVKKILCHKERIWAEDRARTGHPDLGKVVLYQMSYFRWWFIKTSVRTKRAAKIIIPVTLQNLFSTFYLYSGMYFVLPGISTSGLPFQRCWYNL